MKSDKLKKSLDAPTLRIVLATTMALLVCAAVAGFVFFRSQLVTYAEQVQLDNAAASVSANDINRLKNLKQDLENNKVAVTRAKNIVADSQHYQYQNQIIEDLTAYAKKAGVDISGLTFTTDSAAAVSGGKAAAVANGAPKVIVPAGLKSVSASVSIKSPVNYQAFIKFIHYIEVNLTKMQISGISLSKIESSDSNVSANPITLEVYTR